MNPAMDRAGGAGDLEGDLRRHPEQGHASSASATSGRPRSSVKLTARANPREPTLGVPKAQGIISCPESLSPCTVARQP
jgi:hypothetical protein